MKTSRLLAGLAAATMAVGSVSAAAADAAVATDLSRSTAEDDEAVSP